MDKKMNQIVKFEKVNKSFKKTTVINNASFSINENAICGFIGPNGAGKTTIIKLLLGIIPASSGQIELFGKTEEREKEESLHSIGTIVGGPSYYGNLNAFQNMQIVANMKEVSLSREEILDCLELVGLQGVGKKKVKHFSMGMKQRLGIAFSLIGNPKFLIWDEPINGLDPEGIIDIRNLILHLHKTRNVTFLISSHILSELDKIVDQVILINKGKICYDGNCDQLLEKYECTTLEEAYMKCMNEGSI